MNILFTLCGRAGSEGLRSKNILPFCGCPLPYYSLAAVELYRAKGTAERMDVALSTDSSELIQLIEASGVPVIPIHRDAALAGDMVRKIDVIRDAAHREQQANGVIYDMVVDLDITSPLRTLDDLSRVIEKRKTVDADVVYTVTEARRNPYFNQVMRHKNGYFSTVCKSTFATRQQAPDIFDMNASIYAYAPAFIASKKTAFDRAEIVQMKDTGILDIDGPEDYELMQVVGTYLFEKLPEYREIRDAAVALSGKLNEFS